MNIKSKLFISYSILLVIFMIVSSISFDAIKRWNKTADNLKSIQEYSTHVNKIRSLMYRQINLGRDFIDDNSITAERIIELSSLIETTLVQFHDKPLTEVEISHFEALEETAVELDWIFKGIIVQKEKNDTEFNKANARKSLSEIVDEISDDIFILNKLYRNQITESIESSKHAGEKAVYLIFLSIAVVLILLIILFVLNQRWLVKPIDEVNKITQKISNGNFATRFDSVQNDEWGDLAKSINNMARSLQKYEIQYRSKERILALGEVAAYTAHNLQNPLAGIRAAVQYLTSKKEATKEQIEYYNDIIDSIDRLNLWIKRFLDFAKPLDLVKKTINVNSIVELALKSVKSKIEFSKVSINFESGNIPEINGDAILLEQLLSVFINNAIEANSSKIEIKTISETDKDGYESVLLTIADNGDGIAEDVKKKLFQAFVTTKQSGTGLGLAQAKKIVDLHYGELTIESAEKIGTNINIKIPSQN